MLWIIGIFVYVLGLFISILASVNTKTLESSTYWVKVVFWPITVVIYLLGLILWLFIWVPRKLFQGIRFCLYEISEFFVDVYQSAIDDED